MIENIFDVVIAYRIYPKVSKTPPVFPDDKLKLAELCLKSLKDSLGTLRFKIYAILDNCPEVYIRLFQKYFNENELELINLPFTGNAGTFAKQIEILLIQNDSEYIYFAEDDYFYFPGQFYEMLELIKNNKDVDFVTSYNHLDYYNYNLHKYKSKIINTQNRKWRKVSTTCLTFLTTKKTLENVKDIFSTYSKKNSDASIWLSLTKMKILNPWFNIKYLFTDKSLRKIIIKAWLHSWKQLLFGKKSNIYVSEPTISTHMDSRFLAPGFDWYQIFSENIEKINFI